ncbi:MAG: gliding motility protein GldN [Prolixibacteraceae bacterium]|nr:gliding motility protein GldN [Prolixibacteraceae bacterium]
MKAIIKIALLTMLPLWAFSQQQGAVRFTEKYGPFNSTYKQENDFAKREVVPYPFVREADVMWRKVTWEIIDLREKMNLPLFYPTDTIDQRKSLINAIMDGIENNQFNAFKVPFKLNAFEFDMANVFRSPQEIRDIGMSSCTYTPPPPDPPVQITVRWEPEEIKQILIKEVWYFNSKDSKLHNEIIGICPIREYHPVNNDCERDTTITLRQRLFWVYYPDVRNYFSKIPVYSMENDKPMYSYDDLFVYRFFNSYFVQEANVYNDRLITDYVTGREAQLESERIKQDIFDFEQDMWEN